MGKAVADPPPPPSAATPTTAVAQWFQSIGATQQVPPPQGPLLQHHNLHHHPFQLHEGLVLQPLHVEFAQPGHVICTFRIPACLTTNTSHIIRTGVLASLVDNVGAAAFVTMDGNVRVSVDINVSYISPAKFGDEIEIDANVLKYGTSVGVVSVDIRNKASGELVAQGRHTMYYPSSKL